jgi:hypothetical protein
MSSKFLPILYFFVFLELSARQTIVVNTYFWIFAKFSTRPIPDTFYSLHPTPYTLPCEQRILFLICPTLSPIIEYRLSAVALAKAEASSIACPA